MLAVLVIVVVLLAMAAVVNRRCSVTLCATRGLGGWVRACSASTPWCARTPLSRAAARARHMRAQFTKPAQSLAPALVVWALPQLGSASPGAAATPDYATSLALVCGVPALTAVAQIALWRLYTLRGRGGGHAGAGGGAVPAEGDGARAPAVAAVAPAHAD